MCSLYFKNLLTSSKPTFGDIERCLANVQPKVYAAMNEELKRPYTNEEVHVDLKQMSPLKSLGPDGFSSYFFQAYWHVIHTKVCQVVLNFLNPKTFEDSYNFTFIVLIPKVSNPSKPSDFRPISLCNGIYKLASKVLTNRLKKVLFEFISPSQSAFTLGRLISDNFSIAYEGLHTMTTRQKDRNESITLKLDMSKPHNWSEIFWRV